MQRPIKPCRRASNVAGSHVQSPSRNAAPATRRPGAIQEPSLASAAHAPTETEALARAPALLASRYLVLPVYLGSRHALCACPEGLNGAGLGDFCGLAIRLLREQLRVEGPSCLRGRRGFWRDAAIAPGIHGLPSDRAEVLRVGHSVRLAIPLGAQVANPRRLHTTLARILRSVLVAHILEARGLAILLRALLRETTVAHAAGILVAALQLSVLRSIDALDLEQGSILLLRGAAILADAGRLF
mmetsp:Transcript_49409/g.124417  ORF Transcript_49409/g.124417 Transcript_49409/m.124417 type:complete len:243 (+) Transcript_49409:66-794(+)